MLIWGVTGQRFFMTRMTRTMLAYADWKSNTEAIRVCQGVWVEQLSIKMDKFS